jgi:hypothetical protein
VPQSFSVFLVESAYRKHEKGHSEKRKNSRANVVSHFPFVRHVDLYIAVDSTWASNGVYGTVAEDDKVFFTLKSWFA